jgi:hypothetical protein
MKSPARGKFMLSPLTSRPTAGRKSLTERTVDTARQVLAGQSR